MSLLATLTGWRLLRFLLRMLTYLVILVLLYLIVTGVQVWLTSRRYQPHRADAIVVMGAAQYDGVPSPDLRARLNEADLLWRERYATMVMVTGYKQKGDRFTESQASAAYLKAQGVPGADILEVGGTDSWENLALAARELKARGDTSVLMVTDPFHEMRSLAIASALGLTARPTPTRTSPITGVASIPYFAKETVGVALGRIIGFDHLSDLHSSLGAVAPGRWQPGIREPVVRQPATSGHL